MARTIPYGPSGIDPVWGRAGYISITIPTFSGGTGEIDSPSCSNNTGVHQGQMVGFKVKANKPSNSTITFTFKLYDRDGDVIYSDATLPVNNATPAGWTTTLVMGLNIPIVEKEIIGILPSGDPGATSLIVRATIYYNPDLDICIGR